MNNTLQKSYPKLANKIGVSQLWIKHEYLNEAGSHKIRLLEKLIKNHLKKRQKNFVISSSGNAGIAAAYYLNKYVKAKSNLTIFVSKNISTDKNQRLKKAINNSKNIKVKKVIRPKQQAFLFAKKHKAVLLRGSIEPIAPQAYYSLAKELIQVPGLKSVFVPTSSGITALGLHQGFKKLKISRDQLIQYLNRKGIFCQIHYTPIYKFRIYKTKIKNRMQNSENYFNSVLSLPIYPQLDISQQDYVIHTLKNYLNKKLKKKYV